MRTQSLDVACAVLANAMLPWCIYKTERCLIHPRQRTTCGNSSGTCGCICSIGLHVGPGSKALRQVGRGESTRRHTPPLRRKAPEGPRARLPEAPLRLQKPGTRSAGSGFSCRLRSHIGHILTLLIPLPVVDPATTERREGAVRCLWQLRQGHTKSLLPLWPSDVCRRPTRSSPEQALLH